MGLPERHLSFLGGSAMYQKRNPDWLRHLDFELLDMFILIMTYLVIEVWRGKNPFLFNYTDGYLYFLICILDCFLIFIMRPYKGVVQRGYWKEAVAIFKHFTTLDISLIICIYSEHLSDRLPRLTIGAHWILSMLIAYGAHLMLKRDIRLKLRKRNNKRIMLFTDSGHAIGTYHVITEKSYSPYTVSSIVLVATGNGSQKTFEQDVSGLKEQEPELRDVEFLNGKNEAFYYLRSHVVDEVFLDRYDAWNNWKDIISDLLAMGLTVHIGLAGLDISYPNSSIQHFGGRYVITTTISSANSWQLSLKRLIDVVGAIIGLIITGICSIFIIPAIKIADPGPVIFSQIRIGTNGRPFRFYKFRSMYMDAEERKAELMKQNEMDGYMFKLENDPRIIGSEKGPGKGLGNFLRSTSLDELPQFWNVLMGDMSLVGTRPPTQQEYEMYENHHKVRLSMKPGITGLWQVSGRSNITDFEEVVRLDTQYIENWSLGQDIKILFKTVLVVLGKVGSK